MRTDTVNIYFKGTAPDPFLQSLQTALQGIGITAELLADSADAWLKADQGAAASIFQDRPAKPANILSITQVLGTSCWLLSNAEQSEIFIEDGGGEGKAIPFFDALAAEVIELYKYPFAMEDFVLVILGHDDEVSRSVRSYSNAEMVENVLKFEPFREVVIWDDPRLERRALQDMRGQSRVSVSSTKIDRLLDACAFTVSQDSDVALRGMLHRKHGIQMGQSGFHHVLRNPVRDQRTKKSFNRIQRDNVPFEKYLKWLMNEVCVDTNKADLNQQVIARLQVLGW